MFLPSFFLLWILLAAQPAWSQDPSSVSHLNDDPGAGWITPPSATKCQSFTTKVGDSWTLTVNLPKSTRVRIFGNIPDDVSIMSATLDGQPFSIPPRPANAACDATLFDDNRVGQHVFKFTLIKKATGIGHDFLGFLTFTVNIAQINISSLHYHPILTESMDPVASTTSSATSTTPSVSRSASTTPAHITPTVSGSASALAVSPTPNGPGSASTSSSAPPSNPKVGPIVGGTVGGIAGLLAAIGAFLLAKSTLPWVSASLAALLGLFAYRTRRLVFTADENIPESQFAFFLTSKNEFTRFERNALVWTVARIGNSQRRFELDVPCRTGHGLTRLCYGTITDNDTHVTLDSWAEAPAVFDVATGTWDKCPEEKGRPKVLSAKKVYANPGDAASDGDSDQIVLGTGEEEKGEMKPFLLISPEEFQTEYKAGTDLYIHAFRVRNDCQSGQYGDKISQDVINDRITPEEGIHVKELAPLTTWSFKQDAKGKLSIKVGENDKSDLKAFKHEFSVKKAAKKPN